MPKMKTHKAAAKRFSFTGTGKLRRTRHMTGHLRRNKSNRALREVGAMLPVARGDAKKIKRLLPYGVK
jgi:large subunit ribosomal protein L35